MFIRTTLLVSSLVAALAFAGCKATDSSLSDASSAVRSGDWQSFGETAVFEESDVVALGSLDGDEKNVWIVGEITEVCLHQGCWIRMKDPSDPAAGDLFVRTKDHAYLVPRNAHGHKVMVYGFSEFSEMSVNDQRHFAEEAGKSEAEIAAITQPKRMVTFHASTIMIEGDGLDKALEQ